MILSGIIGGLVAGVVTVLTNIVSTRLALKSVDKTTNTTLTVARETINNARAGADKTIRSNDEATAQRELAAKREEWWRRFTWAAELSMSEDDSNKVQGLEMLMALGKSPLAGPDEQTVMAALPGEYTRSIIARRRARADS